MEALITLILGILILIPIIALMVIPVALWRGYVLSVLWGWFIVPTFNAPAIGVVTAMGISLVVGMFAYHRSQKTKEGEKDTTVSDYLLNGFVSPAIALGVGYVLTHWL